MFFFPVCQESIFFVVNDDFLKKMKKCVIFFEFQKPSGESGETGENGEKI